MSNALEVKTMNRQQRRAHQKNIEWINSLNRDKQELINKVVQDRAKEISREVERESLCVLMEQIGTSITGALVLLNDDVSMTYIENFLEVFDEFLTENVDFVKTEGKNWKMKLEKMEPKVLEKVESLLKQGVLKKTLVEEVRKEFPSLTKGQIFNAYKLAKDRITDEEEKKNTKEITSEDAVKYVFADEENKDEGLEYLEYKEIPKDIKIEDKIIAISKEEVKEVKKVSKLKVIKKEIELEGEYGAYRVSDGMAINHKNEVFKSLEDVEKYEKAEIERFARKMSELKEVMQYI